MVIIIFTAANAAGLLALALYMLIAGRRDAREREAIRASIKHDREAARRRFVPVIADPDTWQSGGISDAHLPIR